MEALFDSRSNNYFQIDPQTGCVTTLQLLDQEHTPLQDNGEPKRSSAAYLTITISDTNDHAPVFEYKVSLRENVEAGFEVLTIRATDRRSPQCQHGLQDHQ